jgi:hypothetical protein
MASLLLPVGVRVFLIPRTELGLLMSIHTSKVNCLDPAEEAWQLLLERPATSYFVQGTNLRL